MSNRVGVAISTTGDEHRLRFLETCVAHWDRALPSGGSLFVTVDGSVEDTERVRHLLQDITESVYRVGQPTDDYARLFARQGVAVSKNTGLELLMDQTQVDHLFLSDDDTWPLYRESLTKHMHIPGAPHNMVCWGASRLTGFVRSMPLSMWSWPRGVMLYQTRALVHRVGGMDERFGPGGHEHVEYSQRIHNAGLTPSPFIAPASYATRRGRGAAALWHAEDMIRPGEPRHEHQSRRAALTSVRRKPGDWEKIEKIMAERAGSDEYVSYRAHQNGRSSATLSANLLGRGAGGEK